MADSETRRKLARTICKNGFLLVTALIAMGMLFLAKSGFPNLAHFVLAVWAMAVAGAADTYTDVLISERERHDR